MCRLSVSVSVFARLALLAAVFAAACAAPAQEEAEAKEQAPALPAPVAGGRLAGALGRLLKEAPERVKTFRDNVRKNAETVRERLGESLGNVITPPTAPATPEQTTTKVRAGRNHGLP